MGWNVTFIYDDILSSNFFIPFVFIFSLKWAIKYYHPLTGMIWSLYFHALLQKARWRMLLGAVGFCHSPLAPPGWQSHVTSGVQLPPFLLATIFCSSVVAAVARIFFYSRPPCPNQRGESGNQSRVKIQGEGFRKNKVPSSLTRKHIEQITLWWMLSQNWSFFLWLES